MKTEYWKDVQERIVHAVPKKYIPIIDVISFVVKMRSKAKPGGGGGSTT